MKTYGVPWNGPLPEHPMERGTGPGRCSQETVMCIYNSLLDCSIKTQAVERVGWGTPQCWSGTRLGNSMVQFKRDLHRAYATPIKCFKMKLIAVLTAVLR